MNQPFTHHPPRTLVLCAGVLMLSIGGCTIGEESVSSSAPSPNTPVQAFAKPTVAQKDAVKVKANVKVVGLLQSTDPSERARQVQAGIKSKDPFSSVPPIVSFKVPLQKDAASTASAPAASAAPQSNPTPVKLPAPPKPPRSAIASLPPLPEPSLAKAVQVTGVIVVGGVPQAIVKAPNEASSRYVQVGQRLSNGQVLVKRIEMNNGSDPIVILEQDGVEVARTVGSPSTPTAWLDRSFVFG